MLNLILAGAALAATADAPLVHQVQVPYAGGTATAAYHGAISVQKRQVGMSLATRPGTARCHWEASINVSRSVQGTEAPPTARIVDRSVLASGHRSGGCMETRQGVEADAARAIGNARHHLVTVASRDHADLIAYLGLPAGTALAAN